MTESTATGNLKIHYVTDLEKQLKHLERPLNDIVVTAGKLDPRSLNCIQTFLAEDLLASSVGEETVMHKREEKAAKLWKSFAKLNPRNLGRNDVSLGKRIIQTVAGEVTSFIGFESAVNGAASYLKSLDNSNDNTDS